MSEQDRQQDQEAAAKEAAAREERQRQKRDKLMAEREKMLGGAVADEVGVGPGSGGTVPLLPHKGGGKKKIKQMMLSFADDE